ncbi:MAG: hypothetical protein AAF682_11980 [Planctomycetota bacterium]
MGSSENKRAGLRGWAVRLGLVLCVLPLAEVAFRGLLWATGSAYSAAETRGDFARLVSEMRDAVPTGGEAPVDGNEASPRKPDRFLHPYLGWETWRGLQIVEAQRKRKKKPRTYEIWVVGGSVAATFGEPDRGGAPALVAALSEDPRFADRNIRVVNHGRGAYKQPQQLQLVGYLLTLVAPPDAVVNLDGFNEVAVANANASMDVHPAYPSTAQWSTLARSVSSNPTLLGGLLEIQREEERGVRIAAQAERYALHRSAITGWVTLRRLKRVRAAWGAAGARYAALLRDEGTELMDGPELPAPAEVAARSARIWAESSRSLHAICADRGIHYLHALQPTLHDEGSKPLTPDEIATGAATPAWVEGVQLGYPLLRKAGARLREQGVAFYDTSVVFAATEETIYHDACHFESAGNRLLARAIAEAFLESVDL